MVPAPLNIQNVNKGRMLRSSEILFKCLPSHGSVRTVNEEEFEMRYKVSLLRPGISANIKATGHMSDVPRLGMDEPVSYPEVFVNIL